MKGGMKVDFEPMVDDVCKHLNVDKNLVKAIISAESSWNPLAETKYARGLMGISKIALDDINLRYGLNYSYGDMFEPRKNVEVGVLYLKWLLDYFKSHYPFNIFYISYAIMAYNFGIGNVNTWLRNTKPDNSHIDEFIPKETRDHLLDVMWWYTYFKNRKIDK
jgi:soluble lytic murein transglycosylase